ncbi:GATOR complex protein DEPDC5 (DEP domain-containing protein 5), partial [Durusdinium trenchii]
ERSGEARAQEAQEHSEHAQEQQLLLEQPGGAQGVSGGQDTLARASSASMTQAPTPTPATATQEQRDGARREAGATAAPTSAAGKTSQTSNQATLPGVADSSSSTTPGNTSRSTTNDANVKNDSASARETETDQDLQTTGRETHGESKEESKPATFGSPVLPNVSYAKALKMGMGGLGTMSELSLEGPALGEEDAAASKASTIPEMRRFESAPPASSNRAETEANLDPSRTGRSVSDSDAPAHVDMAPAGPISSVAVGSGDAASDKVASEGGSETGLDHPAAGTRLYESKQKPDDEQLIMQQADESDRSVPAQRLPNAVTAPSVRSPVDPPSPRLKKAASDSTTTTATTRLTAAPHGDLMPLSPKEQREAGSKQGDKESAASLCDAKESNEPASPPAAQPKQQKHFNLTSHSHNDFGSELVLNPDLFLSVKVGDYVEIFHPNAAKRKLLMQGTSLEPIRGNIEVSLLKSIITNPAFQLQTFQPVVTRKVDPKRYTLSYIEVSFKDQYISQGEFWRFRDAMRGRSCFIGQKISLCGVNISFDEMLTRGNKPVACGIVKESTKFIFRSCSARLFWLVQMSKEMWDFTEDGELYFERFLNRFVTDVFQKWTAKGVTHRLTVVYFCRTYFNKQPPPDDPAVNIDYDGRYFTDLYHTVVENETRADWNSLKLLLKENFHQFPSISGWQVPDECYDRTSTNGDNSEAATETSSFRDSDSASTGSNNQTSDDVTRSFSADGAIKYTSGSFGSPLSFLTRPLSPKVLSTAGRSMRKQLPARTGRSVAVSRATASSSPPEPERDGPCFGLPCIASEGNCLEAINLCLNILDKHFMDRELVRTGQAMVLVTAGSGVLEVDRQLTHITKQRMMDNAIGCDFVSLTRAPLHVAPLFVYKPATDCKDCFDRVHPFAPPWTYQLAKSSSCSPEGGAQGASSPPDRFRTQRKGAGSTSASLEDGAETTLQQQQRQQQQQNQHHHQQQQNHPHDVEAVQKVLPVFNIPHWIHLSFPYHKTNLRTGLSGIDTMRDLLGMNPSGAQPGQALNHSAASSDHLKSSAALWKAQLMATGSFAVGEQFEPLPFNRMFDLTDPERSSMPVALLNHLYIDKVMRLDGPDHSQLRRAPTRDLTQAWYPLVSAMTNGVDPAENAQHSSPPNVPNSVLANSPSLRAMQLGFRDAITSLELARKQNQEDSLQQQHLDGEHTEAYWTTEKDLDRTADEWTERWSERLTRNMERFNRFDSTVFVKPRPQRKPAFIDLSRKLAAGRSHSSVNMRGLGLQRSSSGWSQDGPVPGGGGVHDHALNVIPVSRSSTIRMPHDPASATMTTSSPEPKEKQGQIMSFLVGKQQQVTEQSKPSVLASLAGNEDRGRYSPPGSVNLLSSSVDDNASRVLFRPVDVGSETPAGKQGDLSSSPMEEGSVLARWSPPGRARSHVRLGKAWGSESIPFLTRQISHISGFSGHSNPSYGGMHGQGTVTINPFDWSVFTSSLYQERLTHNRRRWSHLFPTGRFDDEGHGVRVEDFGDDESDTDSRWSDEESEEEDEVMPLTIESFRLNWKSLQSPGILPLTTDYMPEPHELKANYTSNFYTVSLDEQSDRTKPEDFQELLRELVCQRLSQDFQLLVSSKRKRTQRGEGVASSGGVAGSGTVEGLGRKARSHSLSKSRPSGELAKRSKGRANRALRSRQHSNTSSSSEVSTASPLRTGAQVTFADNADHVIGKPRVAATIDHPTDDDSDDDDDDEDDESVSDSDEDSDDEVQDDFGMLRAGSPRMRDGVLALDQLGRETQPTSPRRRVLRSTSRGARSFLSGNTMVLRLGGKKHKASSDASSTTSSLSSWTHGPLSTKPSRPFPFAANQRTAKAGGGSVSSGGGGSGGDLRSQGKSYVLTMGHHIFELELVPENHEVNVRGYEHNSNSSVQDDTQTWRYQYLFYDGIEKKKAPVEIEFASSGQVFSWNRLDMVVCGMYEDFESTVRYRRNMFSILPSRGEGDDNISSQGKRRRRGLAASLDAAMPGSGSVFPSSVALAAESAAAAGDSQPEPPISESRQAGSAIPPPVDTGSQKRRIRRFGSAAVCSGERSRDLSADLPVFSPSASTLPSPQELPEASALPPIACDSTLSPGPDDWIIERLSREEEEKIVAGFRKFRDWLQSRVRNEKLHIEIRQRFSNKRQREVEHPEGLTEPLSGEDEAEAVVAEGQMQIEQETEVDDSVLTPVVCGTAYLKVEINGKDANRLEWLVLKFDKVFTPYQSFHIEVQWMVAAGATIQNFVNLMSRKAKQAGLNFQQIPEYCRSTALEYGSDRRVPHPFVLPKEITFSRQLDQHPHFTQLLVGALQSKLGFAVDSVDLERKTSIRWPTLVQKNGYAFLHLSRRGIEFLQNRLVATSTRHKEIYETGLQLFRDTRDFCQSLDIAFGIVNDIVDGLDLA